MSKVTRIPMAQRPKRMLMLRDDDSDGISTLDLVNGLQGVCYALDQNAGTEGTEYIHRLSMAAKVLATMVADRVEIQAPRTHKRVAHNGDVHPEDGEGAPH